MQQQHDRTVWPSPLTIVKGRSPGQAHGRDARRLSVSLGTHIPYTTGVLGRSS